MKNFAQFKRQKTVTSLMRSLLLGCVSKIIVSVCRYAFSIPIYQQKTTSEMSSVLRKTVRQNLLKKQVSKPRTVSGCANVRRASAADGSGEPARASFDWDKGWCPALLTRSGSIWRSVSSSSLYDPPSFPLHRRCTVVVAVVDLTALCYNVIFLHLKMHSCRLKSPDALFSI